MSYACHGPDSGSVGKGCGYLLFWLLAQLNKDFRIKNTWNIDHILIAGLSDV